MIEKIYICEIQKHIKGLGLKKKIEVNKNSCTLKKKKKWLFKIFKVQLIKCLMKLILEV